MCVRTLGKTPLGTIEVLILELVTAHEGEVEQKGQMQLWVTDDTRRIPVRAIVRTNVGPIRADLVQYRPAP